MVVVCAVQALPGVRYFDGLYFPDVMDQSVRRELALALDPPIADYVIERPAIGALALTDFRSFEFVAGCKYDHLILPLSISICRTTNDQVQAICDSDMEMPERNKITPYAVNRVFKPLEPQRKHFHLTDA
jgi:hypothetical protein